MVVEAVLIMVETPVLIKLSFQVLPVFNQLFFSFLFFSFFFFFFFTSTHSTQSSTRLTPSTMTSTLISHIQIHIHLSSTQENLSNRLIDKVLMISNEQLLDYFLNWLFFLNKDTRMGKRIRKRNGFTALEDIVKNLCSISMNW